MTARKVTQLRQALEGLPNETSYGEPRALATVYFPQSHLKAMHPDVAVVTGMRGAGKTFWWTALQHRSVRKLIGERYERTGVSDSTVVRTGFGAPLANDHYPSKDVLADLLKRGTDARLAWRTVQAWQLAPKSHPLRREEDWRSRTSYVEGNPEQVDRLFADRDAKLAREDRHLIVIYDALDRAADDWQTMYRVIRGLLQTALDMRGYRHIRVKVFLRTDQFNSAAIGDFPMRPKCSHPRLN